MGASGAFRAPQRRTHGSALLQRCHRYLASHRRHRGATLRSHRHTPHLQRRQRPRSRHSDRLYRRPRACPRALRSRSGPIRQGKGIPRSYRSLAARRHTGLSPRHSRRRRPSRLLFGRSQAAGLGSRCRTDRLHPRAPSEPADEPRRPLRHAELPQAFP